MLYYGWAFGMVQSFSPPLKILAITASTIFTLTIFLIPAALPQLATILYLQRDLEHLAAELMRAVNVEAAEEFKHVLGKVSSINRRWQGFLFWHFLLNGTGTIMYALQEVFAFNHAAVVMNAPMNWAGPLVASSCCGRSHVLLDSMGRFACAWRLQTMTPFPERKIPA